MNQGLDYDNYYPGKFMIEGQELQGNLVINFDTNTLSIHIQREIDIPTSMHLKYIKVISGVLATGTQVMLFNNTCVYDNVQLYSHQDLIYKSRYIVFGNSHKCYNTLRCVIENGLQWSGTSQIDTRDPMEVKIQPVKEVVFSLFGAKVVFSTCIEKNDLWSSMRKEECSINERLEMTIMFSDKKEIAEFIDIRDKVLSLISYAIKDNVNVLKQYLSNEDDYKEYGEEKVPIEFQLFTSEQKNKLLQTHINDYNFFLPQLSDAFEFQEKLSKLLPVLNLYLSLYRYPDMPVEMLFLNIVQAIETFHARFFFDNKDEYEKDINTRYNAHPMRTRIKELLLCEAQRNRQQIILYSRINHLLIDDGNSYFYSFYYQNDDFTRQIVDTRNYYTHYNEKKKGRVLSGNSLINAIIVLRLLLDMHICKVLGIDNKEKINFQLKSILEKIR